MNETPPQNQPPAPPVQPSLQAAPPAVPSNPAGQKKRSSASAFFYAFLTFLIGIGIGYVLVMQFPGSKVAETSPNNSVSTKPLQLPGDALTVQACVEQKGELHAKATDLPQGPLYMVDKNKVVGIEYVLNQEDFTKGKVYENLDIYNSLVDHMQVATIPADYNGNAGTYYVVDLYFVDKKAQANIVCAIPSPIAPDASASADVSTNPSPEPAEKPAISSAVAPSATVISPVPTQ
jgi:hypothetical protein